MQYVMCDEGSNGMDAKEIYQAVLEECMSKINRIKDEYGEALVATICDSLSQQYFSRIDNLEKQNRQLAFRLEKIEAELKVKKNDSSENAVTVQKPSEKVVIDYGFQLSAFEYDGWYYYANEKMGEFLYRVKIDGTCNEQLTDYSVLSMRSSAKVKNGKLYFYDSDYCEQSIEL